MKTKINSLGWLLLLMPFLGATVVHAATNHVTRFHAQQEIRSVGNFHSLSSSGSFIVEVKFGNQESVTIDADPDIIKEIETVVEGGELKIRYRRNLRIGWNNTRKVNIVVTAKKIEQLSQSGSGSITVLGNIPAKQLDVALSGSGRIEFESSGSVCNAKISGSGRIQASGNVKESNVNISGSGRFDGADLRSEVANLKISGSGNINIHAKSSLNGGISGSGNINYSGNAKTSFKSSGSGKLRKI